MSTVFELVVWMTAASAGALFLGVLAYSLGSFALMSRHVARRSIGSWFRELGREVTLAMLTQPLLPLYYLYGQRMGGSASTAEKSPRVPVVFVHGYFHNRVGFVALARALTRKGIGPLYGFNYPWFVPIESNAKRLEAFIAHVCRETGSAAVDVVCHSMGGLVAIEMLRNQTRSEEIKVRRCVTIATPHAGVAWRGPIPGSGATSLRRGSKLLEAHAGYMPKVPTLSIFSTHDNIVHPKETSQLSKRGGRDVEVDGRAHLSILFSPIVAEHVASFLLETEAPTAVAELVPASGVGVVDISSSESEEIPVEAAREHA